MGRLYICLVLWSVACSDRTVPSPFVDGSLTDAGGVRDTGAGSVGAEAGEAETAVPPGRPCVGDSDCDDSVDCTFDRCSEEWSICENIPDDALCQNDVYCDGLESCDQSLGCVAGPVVSCSDNNTCTLDRCLESERTCQNDVRDADGDGDPDGLCTGGDDCRDRDPYISSQRPELCGNGEDDNCDGAIDEASCTSPEYDTCESALLLTGSDTRWVSTAGAIADYGHSCIPTTGGWSELVLTIRVTAPNQDVEVIAQSDSGLVGLARAEKCGDVTTESLCVAMTPLSGGGVARLRLRDLSPGDHTVYLGANSSQDVRLSVSYEALPPSPVNETCGTATALAPAGSVTADLVHATSDLASACAESDELVYRFDLLQPQDVRLFAVSLDGYGIPWLSLRSESCSLISDEIGCVNYADPELFRRNLAPGRYYVAVGAVAPTVVSLSFETSEPTVAPPEESCEVPPQLEWGVPVTVGNAPNVDDIALGCEVGFRDVAYEIDVPELSDLLILASSSANDKLHLGFLNEDCSPEDWPPICSLSDRSPHRLGLPRVEAGTYRLLVESLLSLPISVTAFRRAASPTVVVPFAGDCASAVPIPDTGARFQGNTANHSSSAPASCDVGGGTAAPDQWLRFSLNERRRVLFDAGGSSYATLLNIRRADECPGTEVPNGCSLGYVPARSFLDLRLDPGNYVVQIDGYNGAGGAWFLDVYFEKP